MNDSSVVNTSDPLAAEPEAIAADPGMTAAEKRRRLEELKLDLIERQTAAGENMSAKSADAKTSDLLRRVSDALAQLQ